MRSQWSCFLSFFLLHFCLAGSRQNLSVMLYLPHTHTHVERCECVCVCVYNLRFSLFSHSSLRSALKFKQSAINYTCWALSIFHFPSFLHSALHFLWATQTFAYFGAPSRVSIRCWLIIAAASASMLRHSLRHSLRQSGSLAVCHCASPVLWQCVSWSKMRPQRSPLPGRGRPRLCQ